MAHPIDVPIAEYAQAAAAACVFELKCRLLADNAGLGDKILTMSLEKLVDRIVERFRAALTAPQVQLLESCQVLRNKLLHLELARHTGKLVSLGEILERGTVTAISLAREEIPALAEQLRDGREISVGESRTVSETNVLVGRVYGWLWESLQSGAFSKSAERFHDGCDVLELLFHELNRETAAALPLATDRK